MINDKAVERLADELRQYESDRAELRQSIRALADRYGPDTVCGWLMGELHLLAAQVAGEVNEEAAPYAPPSP